MAENKFRENTFKKSGDEDASEKPKISHSGGPSRVWRFGFFMDPRFSLAFGFFLILSGLYFFVAFISYLFTGKADQSVIEALMRSDLMESGRETANWLGLYGAIAAHYAVYKWLGVAAFAMPPLLFLLGFDLVFKKPLLSFSGAFTFLMFCGLWLSLLLGSITHSIVGVNEIGFLSGGLGYYLAVFFDGLFGWGIFLVLILSLLVFIIYYFNITKINAFKADAKLKSNDAEVVPEEDLSVGLTVEEKENDSNTGEIVLKKKIKESSPQNLSTLEEKEEESSVDEGPASEPPMAHNEVKFDLPPKAPQPSKKEDVPLSFVVEIPKTETEVIADKLVTAQGLYDPTLDLSGYQLPPLDLLNEYETGKIQVTQEELNQNKDKIVETLTNFKIGITSIKATIGPTVTLYEIVPEAGIKISRIKNLEDDIALSLSALGIRIIAPIPGRGTIGIEVPNKKREMVSIRSVLATEKFQQSGYELPVAIGKNISNEVVVVDLTKLPHLLVAGATGQGKSVGLNVILTSLLYKKHPSQLKLILVDPKKVEMSLFSKIERHYLAKLSNAEEAIITDTKKVVYTLNSLCIEMENRYEILKEAGARNLKEYNTKFVERRLNPKDGHRFLPYIVLVIDELADLMMTAGKEVETPIARLAQLARAIGIHLVVATQRPSVNVITGIIKANFPARLSFRVTSKIDSRTILDAGGAEQLIGQGDMLLSTGSDIMRIQSAFVDTPEIERVCEFIGGQRGYPSAYQLPEFIGDEEEGAATVDLSKRDDKFEEAAHLIVAHQQGSTSLLQRKMSLGYNRSGRLIDQLEAAGIVGAFQGSKPREVLIKDEISLQKLLDNLKEKHHA